MLYKTFIAFCLLLIWVTLAVAPAFAFEDTDCQFCTSNHCPAKKATPSCHHKASSKSAIQSNSCSCKHQAPLFTYDAIFTLFELDSHEIVTPYPEPFPVTHPLIDLQGDSPPPKSIVS